MRSPRDPSTYMAASIRWALVTMALAVALPAAAQPAADRGGAIVVFPYVVFDSSRQVDTQIILSNAAPLASVVRCFYEITVGQCAGSTFPATQYCVNDLDCPGTASCQHQYSVTEFSLSLAAGQPVAWSAGVGLANLIPPAVSDPFIGALRCVGVDDNFQPIDASLEGAATISADSGVNGHPDLASYNAYAFAYLGGNSDQTLILGGDQGEYSACPSQTILEHAFQGATDPVTGSDSLRTTLVLLPCSANFENFLTPPDIVVHLNVYNEFAQRSGTSKHLTAQLAADLSQIHPTLFEFATQGTLAGQTHISTASDAVVGIALEYHQSGAATRFSLAKEVHFRGMSASPSTIFLTPVL